MSALAPALKENNVRLVGVGVEKFGVEEFIEGKFFDGDLFVDAKKESYKAMGYGRMGMLKIASSLLSAKWKSANAQAKKMGLGGDLKGDGYQNGGALVVDAGGKTLLAYVQEDAADHVENEKILEALGISGPAAHSYTKE